MNTDKRNRWRIERQVMHNQLAIYHVVEGRNGCPDQFVTFEATAHEIEPHLMNPHGPSWAWSEVEAQQIMDELWRTGIRPQDGRGSGAQVEAMQVHLHDLRRSFGKVVATKYGLHMAQQLLRHADVRVTERIYAPLTFKEQQKATNGAARVVKFKGRA